MLPTAYYSLPTKEKNCIKKKTDGFIEISQSNLKIIDYAVKTKRFSVPIVIINKKVVPIEKYLSKLAGEKVELLIGKTSKTKVVRIKKN